MSVAYSKYRTKASWSRRVVGEVDSSKSCATKMGGSRPDGPTERDGWGADEVDEGVHPVWPVRHPLYGEPPESQP